MASFANYSSSSLWSFDWLWDSHQKCDERSQQRQQGWLTDRRTELQESANASNNTTLDVLDVFGSACGFVGSDDS
ncbi:hypothetical protein HK405_001418, partial [Cladochytrium tenue]